MILPGMGLATASWMAYMIMNGVTIPGVSAGSNQVGASEMWTAQVNWPSAAIPGVGAVSPSVTSSSTVDRARRWLMVTLLGRSPSVRTRRTLSLAAPGVSRPGARFCAEVLQVGTADAFVRAAGGTVPAA